MAGSILAQLCGEVNSALQRRDGDYLQSVLQIEPPFTAIYEQLIAELRATFPASDEGSTARLESGIRQSVGETDEGEDAEGRPVPSWTAMATFLAAWLAFVRDVDATKLLETYQDLTSLLQKGISALQHPTKGVLLMPTLLAYSKIFTRIAVGVDKQPELIEKVTQNDTDDGSRESFPEKTANVIRPAFIACVNDKATAPGGIINGKPDGKKAGVYKFANLCLKVLFQADKLDQCLTIFRNIDASAPPLRFYPASERVTYLYYLGRYLFATDEFYQAQLVLQTAYNDCHTDISFVKQRRLILIYLISANIILGRFPSSHLLSRPEAQGSGHSFSLGHYFNPVAKAIRTGNLELWERLMGLQVTTEESMWFRRHHIFYQIEDHCKPLVWRSLIRRVFVITGQLGTTQKAAPTLDLNAVLAAFLYLEKRALMTPAAAQLDSGPGRRPATFALEDFTPAHSYVDPDFEGLEDLGVKVQPYVHMPDMLEIEFICASLVDQGLLNGYLSHKMSRFAIQGARKAGSAVQAGFPNLWEVFKGANVDAGRDQVEGWVKEMRRPGASNIVRLTSARAAGS